MFPKRKHAFLVADGKVVEIIPLCHSERSDSVVEESQNAKRSFDYAQDDKKGRSIRRAGGLLPPNIMARLS